MKITYIYGNMTHYDHGLSELLKRTKDIFQELEVETETIDLGALHPPYYDGEMTNAMDGVMDKLATADGIVLACTAQIFAPTALMQSFLEYLEAYDSSLVGKHFMLITLSQSGGEKSAGDYLTRVVNHKGGFVVSVIGLQTRHLGELYGDIGEFVDKTTEDFYRAVHKKRRYVIPLDATEILIQPEVEADTEAKLVPMEVPKVTVVKEMPTPTARPRPFDFSDSEEKEIDELSVLFAKKYTNPEEDAPIEDKPSPAEDVILNVLNGPSNPFAPTTSELEMQDNPFAPVAGGSALQRPAPSPKPPPKKVVPSGQSAEGITRRIPDFFQSQLSAGLQAVIQLNITGSEKFDGFIYIHSTECTYTEGSAPAPDIIIIADTAIWMDVLQNKNTAQKAFMTGGIKVRGDFVLLSKFDTLFKFPDA